MEKVNKFNKRSGRVNIGAIFASIVAIMIGIVIIFSQDSPRAAGTRFMDALARHDVAAVSSMSVLGKDDPETIKKKWDRAINIVGFHYGFAWTITGEVKSTDTSAAVRMQLERNIQAGGSYEEKFELPMIKVDGKWKVDVGGLDRRIFPGLPQPD